MTLAQLKSQRSAIAANITRCRNAEFAEGTSEAIKQQIISSNVRKYQQQIDRISSDIQRIEGKQTVKQSPFANLVLPKNFKL